MKFEYDGELQRTDVVAFVDENGNLVIYNNYGGKTCICAGGNIHQNPYTEHSNNGTRKKFYPGDKITITF